jgi:hypothetical protein
VFTKVHNLQFGLNSLLQLFAAAETLESTPVFAVFEAPQTIHALSSLQFVSVQLRHVQKVPLLRNIFAHQTMHQKTRQVSKVALKSGTTYCYSVCSKERFELRAALQDRTNTAGYSYLIKHQIPCKIFWVERKRTSAG